MFLGLGSGCFPVGSSMKKALFTLLALGVAGGCFWLSLYLTREPESDAMRGRGDSVVKVAVAPVVRKSLVETMTYAGSVEAMESVTILPKVTGIVEAVRVDLGDKVAKGDEIVVIDDEEFVQRLKQMRANLQLAEAQLKRSRIGRELAELDFERSERLTDQGLGTGQEMDSSTAQRDTAGVEVDLARAEVARMRAAVEEAQLSVDNTRIVAPMGGYVAKRYVDPGALASPSTPLLALVNTDPAKVVVHVPESDIALAQVGRRVTVTVAGGAIRFAGKVERVAPTLDESTRTTSVEIKVPNAQARLRPGMSADVAIVARESTNALVIPEDALMRGSGRPEVYRVSQGKAQSVAVELGIQEGGFAEVVGGLEEGDLVIVRGQFMVEHGAPVEYEPPKPVMTDS